MSNSSPWNETRRDCLRSLCDTLFPALNVESDPHGLWRRAASDQGVHLALLDVLENHVPPVQRAGTLQLLDALSAMGFTGAQQDAREKMLMAVYNGSPQTRIGVGGLMRMILALCYCMPDLQGRNANWPAISYPGPLRAASPTDKPIRPLSIEDDEVLLDADVCVVGSGAGGGVIAGELARRGKNVVVLEAGGYYNESDFNHLELWSHRNLYWRGGYNPTVDDTVRVIAGSALGGGTLVNWENCLRPPEWVRAEWEREHGLDGLSSPEFTAHIDGVWQRLQVNDACSDLNGPHLRFEAGARRLGYNFVRTFRNVDPRKYDADTAGYHGYGDLTGSRQSTLNTYLQDAYALGARILVRTRAERITHSAGRATGVEAVVLRADGRRAKLTVRAPTVVAACGALETPALLLRSGIGGPAAGQYLRLHPCIGVTARYAEDQAAWWGPPQAAVCDQFARLESDYGFLIEGTHHSLATLAAAQPWRSGREHKQRMSESNRLATLIAIIRDRGHGRVTLGPDGNGMFTYPVDDALDQAHLLRGSYELARIHEAAGADEIRAAGRIEALEWQRGKDLEVWLRELQVAPKVPNAQSLFSAHQMGSARMGRDPNTSCANPDGELHDTHGVWIGDTSAFPTAPGVNPMISCMSLASRTASRIAR
ncbi:MAG TPA: GMC family oxidoreductase [Polyangiales bacterium]|nr:GMC family oxidoreductase [Polyangiales bacterium]